MSQSSKTLHEFGALSIKEDLRLKTGSTTALSPTVTPAHTALADADATLTTAQIRTGILSLTATGSKTLTLPTAALLADFLQSVGDSIDFSVINLGADGTSVVVAAGTGGSTLGFMTVRDSDATAASDVGSGLFRVRQTNVTSGSEAYVIYRLS